MKREWYVSVYINTKVLILFIELVLRTVQYSQHIRLNTELCTALISSALGLTFNDNTILNISNNLLTEWVTSSLSK
jgi:hypothetical protein